MKLDDKGTTPGCPLSKVCRATADAAPIRVNSTQVTGRDTSVISQASTAAGIDTKAVEMTQCSSASGIPVPTTIRWRVILFTLFAVLAPLLDIVRQ